jgi:hypothetical protein
VADSQSRRLRDVAKLGPKDDPKAPDAELDFDLSIEDFLVTQKPKRRRADGEDVEWLPAQESAQIAGTN